MVAAASDAFKGEPRLSLRMSMFASVKMTIPLLVAIAAVVLVGAWCPQEAQGGRDKVIEAFGPQMAAALIKYGVTDIYHSPLFLGLIGLLTVNMVACSVQRVFPKVRTLRQPLALLGREAITKMPVNFERAYDAPSDAVLERLQDRLRASGYVLESLSERTTAQWGKWGRLAPTITHIGLLTLLAGVSITSWTGFTGFQAVPQHEIMSFERSEHSKQWLGKLPNWTVHVDSTRRENYEGGDAKQWYSVLSVLDPNGKVLKTQEISVNNPLSYDGVDIYQSSWGLGSIALSFNGKRAELPLRQMGPKINAAFLPLDKQTIMLFSVHSPEEPIRVFAKVPEWPAPRILTVLEKGKPQQMGGLSVTYEELIPVTGLQYKSDPGLPITYVAFGFIMLGVMLAAVPHRQVWAAVQTVESGGCRLTVGGVSRKAKTGFEKNLAKLIASLDVEFPSQRLATPIEEESQGQRHASPAQEAVCQTPS